MFDLVFTQWIPSSQSFLDNIKINHITTTLLTIEKDIAAIQTAHTHTQTQGKKENINSNIISVFSWNK